jgi:hypothetical protein
MSRAFFSRFGKTCHVFLPAISAKNVAPISGQAVTLLDKLYLIPSSLARLPRKEVLIPSPVVMGFAQTDIGNLSARIRLPRFVSVDYTGFLPEEHNAERNYGHVGRSEGVPNCKQRSAGHVPCRFSFPAVLPEPGVAANEGCTYNIHTAAHEGIGSEEQRTRKGMKDAHRYSTLELAGLDAPLRSAAEHLPA